MIIDIFILSVKHARSQRPVHGRVMARRRFNPTRELKHIEATCAIDDYFAENEPFLRSVCSGLKRL